MEDMPHNRHGLIPMLVAIRVTAERKRRDAEAAAKSGEKAPPAETPKKKKRGWF
ncbi:hypothetical protein [Brevundimonas sp.]|uniref:hypothetical protein n=1 Tax=Brevundimonas sp. TaxID=1871086 RepID=UPI003F6E69F7